MAAEWVTIPRPDPLVALFVLMLLLAAVLPTAWPAARKAMLSVPMRVLVAFNIVRVFAVLFLMLAAEGQLTGPFSHGAAWTGIITAFVAAVLWLLTDAG